MPQRCFLLAVAILAVLAGCASNPDQPEVAASETTATSDSATRTGDDVSATTPIRAEAAGSNGVRAMAPLSDEELAVAPTPTLVETPTLTPSATPPPTVVPYLYPFVPLLAETSDGGTYETGRAPCDEDLFDPLWLSVTRFALVCDDGRVIAMDADLGHETWVGELPVDESNEWFDRSNETTTSVGFAVVDATMHTIPASGLGAETYELIVTVLDGDSGTETAQYVFEASSDRYRFWWSPLQARAIVGYRDLGEQRHVVVLDTETGTELLDRTDLWPDHDDQRIDGRYVPVELDSESETMRFLDLATGALTAATTRLHDFFEHDDHQCSPYIAAKTGLMDDTWHLIDPIVAGVSVPVPQTYFPELVTNVGLLIRSSDEWAMLSPDGITWTLDRSVARQARHINGELSFVNQSGDWIAVDSATGSEIGPARHDGYTRYTTTNDGSLHAAGQDVTYLAQAPCTP